MQKVSAIVRAGTWGETTSWGQETQLDAQSTGASFGVMWGDKHSHPMASVSGAHINGRASSQGQGSTSGSTALARLLAAPVRPAPPTRQPLGENELKFSLGIPFFLMLGWLAGIVVWWVAFPITMLCLLLLVGGWWSSLENYKQAKADHPQQERLYFARYTRWEQLYYCPRCDHVFHPQNQNLAPVGQMSSLLEED